MRELINIVIVVMICMTLYSCKENTSFAEMKKIVEKWNGKEIIFPQNVSYMFMDKDTICVSSNIPSYKILVYTDSTGCVDCKAQLYKWNGLIEEFENEMGDLVSFLFFFQPKSGEDIQTLFRENNFRYPSYIDVDNELNRLNNFPTDSRLQTFLLNEDNKVVLIGNPINNPQIRNLYKQTIKGKEKISLVDADGKLPITSIEIEEQVLELGELKKGETSKVRFHLKNTGRNPLVLMNVSSSCGCIVLKWIKEPIAPNETTEILVEVTPNSKGYFRKTITVYCNVEFSPIVMLIKGEIK